MRYWYSSSEVRWVQSGPFSLHFRIGFEAPVHPLWSPVRSFRQFGPNQIGVGARSRRSALDRLLGLSLVAARTRPLSRVTTARGNQRRWWHESIHSFWAGRIVPHLRSIFMILCFQTKYLKMRSSCPFCACIQTHLSVEKGRTHMLAWALNLKFKLTLFFLFFLTVTGNQILPFCFHVLFWLVTTTGGKV